MVKRSKKAQNELQVVLVFSTPVLGSFQAMLPSDVDGLAMEKHFGDGFSYFAFLSGSKNLLDANADSGGSFLHFAAPP